MKLRAKRAGRIALLGGAPLEGRRHIWWNFVASTPERIERAKREWAEGKFAQVPGETEFIPLPPGEGTRTRVKAPMFPMSRGSVILNRSD